MRWGFGRRLVEGVLADDLTQGGLDGHHRLDGVDDAVVDDGADVDAGVVAGDDALGSDRRRDDAQAHPVQDVGGRDDDGEPAGRTPMTRPSRNSTPCSYCLTTRISE